MILRSFDSDRSSRGSARFWCAQDKIQQTELSEKSQNLARFCYCFVFVVFSSYQTFPLQNYGVSEVISQAAWRFSRWDDLELGIALRGSEIKEDAFVGVRGM